MSGLSGFPARFERFERFGRFGRFFGKTAQTAQMLLKKPLKNRSFLEVIFERFFKQDLGGFWAVFERSSRVEVPDSTFLFSAKLERTRSSRGDQYVVIFQKVPKNSIFDQLITSTTPPPAPTYPPSPRQRTPSPQRTPQRIQHPTNPPPPNVPPLNVPPNPRRNPLTFNHPPRNPQPRRAPSLSS